MSRFARITFVLSLFISSCGMDLNSQMKLSQGLEVERFQTEPDGAPTKFPVVFVSGIFSNGGAGDAVRKLLAGLEADGHRTYLTAPPAISGVENRLPDSRKAVRQALEETGAAKVNLLAYSMGALDARCLASEEEFNGRIASVTTLSGVNYGAPSAANVHKIISSLPESWQGQIEKFVIGMLQHTEWGDDRMAVLDTLKDLSPEGAAEVGRRCRPNKDVYYQSFASLATVLGGHAKNQLEHCEGRLWGDHRRPHRMAGGLAGSMLAFSPLLEWIPSDGTVSVEAQKFGDFRGCVPTDHWGIIGLQKEDVPRRTGFDVAKFYRNIVFNLSANGY